MIIQSRIYPPALVELLIIHITAETRRNLKTEEKLVPDKSLLNQLDLKVCEELVMYHNTAQHIARATAQCCIIWHFDVLIHK